MAKYRIRSHMTVYFETEIDAENSEDAWNIANNNGRDLIDAYTQAIDDDEFEIDEILDENDVCVWD